MMAFLFGLLHTGLVLAGAPLVTGIVRLTKARLQGRRGASVLQPYRDLWRLLQKESVIAESASWLFRIAPYLIFVSVWLAATIMEREGVNARPTILGPERNSSAARSSPIRTIPLRPPSEAAIYR